MLSVLIVDTCKISTVMTSELFKERVNGTTVTLCQSAKDCLQTLGEKAFDLVIVDINLPDLDGISLIRKIKKSFNTPTFLTAYPIKSVIELVGEKLFLYQDASQWISKPIRPKELEKSLEDNSCSLENLSLRGALVSFENKVFLNKKDQGNISFNLSKRGSRSKLNNKLRLKFETVWVHKKNKQAGLFFTNINERQQSLLEVFLKKQKKIISELPKK
jgi:CheY-like chemotaxis protein